MMKTLSLQEYRQYQNVLFARPTESINCEREGYFVITKGKGVRGIGKAFQGKMAVSYLGDSIRDFERDINEEGEVAAEVVLEKLLVQGAFPEMMITCHNRMRLYSQGTPVVSFKNAPVERKALRMEQNEWRAFLVEHELAENTIFTFMEQARGLIPQFKDTAYFYSPEKGLFIP